MKKRKESILIKSCLCGLLIFLCTSCTMIKAPSVEKKESEKIKPSDQLSLQETLSPYSELEQKGDKEIKNGNYRSALNIYNHLLSKYSGKEKEMLMGKIEALLSIMKTSDLEIVLKSKKNLIPEDILRYRIGMNYANKQKDIQKAKATLTSFLADYPDNPRAAEVKGFLKELEKQSFGKNRIGCMLPLSGKYQVFGKQALRGIQLAQQDLKAQFPDKEIEFEVKDTESSDQKAVECVQELASGNVAAIVGPLVTSEAAAKEAQNRKIPMVCLTQKSEVASTGDYVFANFITPEIQIKGLVNYATQVLGIRNFAIFYPDDKYGQTFMNLYRQTVSESKGNMLLSEMYGAGETDFSGIIKKLGAASSQSTINPAPQDAVSADAAPASGDTPSDSQQPMTALFIPDAPSKAALILPQLLYYNVKNMYLLGTNIWHNDALLKIAPEHLQNLVITDGYFAGSMKPEAARFAEAFKTAYGEAPGFIEAIAYDTATMLLKSAMDPAIDSRASLREALAGNLIYSGVTGETMFESNGVAQKEIFFLKVDNGAFTEIVR